MRRGPFVWLCAGMFTAASAMLIGQTLVYTRTPDAKNGKTVYEGGCIACHGADGRGAPPESTAFKRPDTFPDFSRCDQTTPEGNYTWKAIILNWGAVSRLLHDYAVVQGPAFKRPDR